MTRNIEWNELSADKKFIGMGSYGAVFRATWNSKNGQKTVAIKQFDQNDDRNKKEIDMLSQVNHDNIVKLIGITKDENERMAIVMEYAECGSLHSLLHYMKNNIILPHTLCISWMLQCAEAIKYLHELSPKLLHRDLKPRNLLLFNNCQTLKICDFGTVKKLETIMTSSTGTFRYMAPEVANTQSYTEKCDVYSFGITFWEVISRKKPFYHLAVSAEVAILIQAYTKGTRPYLDDIRNIPNSEHIIKLIESCWNGDAEKRPTMKEIISTIKNLYPIMDVEMPYFGLKIPDKNEVNKLIDEWKNITIEGEPIGSGTFGEVYKALWKTEKGLKTIAVKRLSDNKDPDNKDYPIKSKKLTINNSQLKHEHILKLYCLSIDDNNRPIELMEYADCGNLYSAVHDCTVNIVNNKYETFSLMWMLHCAKGLKFLHDQNIIHRDINTRKLLLFNNYQTLKISLSQTVRTESTVMTEIVGTFEYMAPEIMEGGQYTKKCDFFSYGIMLWEVMSRKKPFYDMREHIPFAIGRKVLQGHRPNINDVIDIQNSDEIKILITKCWDADPQKRPSMEEVFAIMEKYSFY